jgi:hypothetical protein
MRPPEYGGRSDVLSSVLHPLAMLGTAAIPRYTRAMLRIRKTRWKVAYIVVGVGLILLINGLFLSHVLPRPVDAVVGNLFTVLLYFGGARSFRGSREPVAPARAWWRMTSRPTAGFVIGALLSVSFASDIFSFSRPAGFTFTYVLGAIVDLLMAFLYFHSSIRLRRTPPETVAEPSSLPHWKPIA